MAKQFSRKSVAYTSPLLTLDKQENGTVQKDHLFQLVSSRKDQHWLCFRSIKTIVDYPSICILHLKECTAGQRQTEFQFFYLSCTFVVIDIKADFDLF